MKKHTRRKFLRQSAVAATGLIGLPTLVGCGGRSTAAQPSPAPAAAPTPTRKLGIAILGLGGYANGQIAPALQLTQHCELRGLITGSPEKLPGWQKKYGITDEHVYTYDQIADLANDDAIDVVYVITPTATHKDFTIQAANTGKHVWCEKPMAMHPEDCRAMIEACEKNKVRLNIGYRMLHEPNTQRMIELSKTKAYGELKNATGRAGYPGGLPALDYWRGQRAMGGGALYDMGVYTINGLCEATQLDPIAVRSAKQDRPQEVDVTTSYELEFAGGLVAQGKTSVVEDMNLLRVEAEKGWYELSPMQTYNGVQGQTSDGTMLGPPVPNQQSLQMDNDALSILQDSPARAPGEMGLRDIRIIRAIIESAESGKRIEL